MKKYLSLLLIPLLMAACSPTQQPSNSNPGDDTGGDVNPGGDTPVEDPDVVEDDDSIIKSISLDKTVLFVVNGTRSSSLLVSYNSTRELTLDEKDVTWTSDDTSIATVDAYGRVSGVALGGTTIVCTTKIGNRKARCSVYVVSSLDDIQKEYQRVDDPSTLKNNDIIIIAAANDNKVASIENQASKLFAESATFNNDKSVLLTYGANTAEFILGDKEERGFTLESQEGYYLAGFNLERMGFVKTKGNIDWHFTLEDGNLYIETHNDVRGWIMFNKDLNNNNGGFTLYERETANNYIYFPTIYRLTIVM